jgi:hypothetical protein
LREEKNMKYVKIFVIIGLALMSIPMLGQQASAHSPGLMLLDYEEDTLDVIILHFTLTPRAHRVFRILISINGELVEEEGYGKQPGFWINIYKFTISAEPGDKITVEAYCSFFGQKTESITV